MTNSPLTVTLDRTDGRTTVRVSGEVDMGTTPALRDGIDRAFTPDPVGTVVVDLRAVTFLASAGLAALASAHTRAQAVDAAFVVVVASGGSPERALRITSLDQVFSVVNGFDESVVNTP